MNRRDFLKFLLTTPIAATLDVEKLLWIPGEKKIFVPEPYETPIGTVLYWYGKDAPQGWLQCNGQQLSRYSFSELHKIIGTIFGGDSNNFLLPDFRGKIHTHNSYLTNDPKCIDIKTIIKVK